MAGVEVTGFEVVQVRARKRDTTVLAAGSAVTGLLAYAVFAITTRALGASSASPVSVLWTVWALTGAALTFPLQHWITRTITRTTVVEGEQHVRAALPRVLAAAIGLAAATTAVTAAAGDLLFGREDLAFPAMAGLVTLGSALVGIVRGTLSAHRRFTAVATSLVAENALRCAVVAALAVGGNDRPAAYGLALVAGHGVVLLWPRALLPGTAPGVGEPDHRPGGGGQSALSFLTGAGAGQLVSQVVLTGGPVLVALLGGRRADVTAMFAALALFRAPYMLAIGVVPQLTGRVSHLLAEGRAPTVRLLLRRAGLAGTVATVVAATGAALVGPWLLRAVFGPEVVLGRGLCAVVAAGCTLAVATLVLSVVALALDRSTGVARCWLVALGSAGVAVVATGTLSAVHRVAGAFALAELVAFLMLWLLAARDAPPGRESEALSRA